MDKKTVKKRERLRTGVQIAFTAITNGYYIGFLKGKIYQGASKEFCVPGLSCYSCPGALGACPIGALQSVANDRNFHISFYVLGFLMAVGAVLGRFVCGWLCPFGLMQDLLYKIPVMNKLCRLPGERFLQALRYIVLALFVLILPMFAVNAFGQGDPWFCKYICPSGTLMAAWPLVLLNEGIRSATGFLFAWKSVILMILIIASVFLYRPFCRYLCPLGAIYGLFNPVALYRYQVDEDKCTGCGACERACKLEIPVRTKLNSPACIRCGNCIAACPAGAISKCTPACRSRTGEDAKQGREVYCNEHEKRS